MNANRRNFIATANCSLLGYSSIFNTLLNLRIAGAAAADQSDATGYKALVCVFLFGGNDSFNMLIPAEPDEYKHYRSARSNMAIPLDDHSKDSALVLPHLSQDGRAFAVHPAMSELRNLYAENRLAFLANAGTLVEPTTVKSYKNRSVKVPAALFSHNDQRDQWQTGLPQIKSRTGWFGRAIDMLGSTGNNQVLNAISLNGNNVLQTGQHSTPFTITDEGSVKTVSDLTSPILDLFHAAELGQNSKQNSIFSREFLQASKNSLENNERFSKEFNKITFPKTIPSQSRLSRSLDAVAKSIKVGRKIGLTRQTYFVLVPGWDNHQNLLEDHHALLRDLSRSLGRFQNTTEAMGLTDSVTTFTASDFARTLRSNGRGTDHAWGGNHFILGDAVRGGTIYGNYPTELLISDGLDVGKNGRLLPTTSCDQYFADLLRWFGIPEHSLKDILPNLENFPHESLEFISGKSRRY